MKIRVLFLLLLAALWQVSVPVFAQDIDIKDLKTDLQDGIHKPVMKSYGRLGYQIDVFGERLRLPGTEIEEITAGGVVFHAPRVGGMYRITEGPLKHTYVFADYTFLSQPVDNVRTGDTFTRSTHFMDAGVGYFFKLVEDRVELAPFLGMSAQFNLNDSNPNFSIAFTSSLVFPLTLKFSRTNSFPSTCLDESALLRANFLIFFGSLYE